MIHLYAVTATPTETVDARGVEDAEVACIDVGSRLYAVASHLPRAAVASRENAMRHAEVVAAAAESTGLLPVRFGAGFADHAQLRRIVEEDAAGLHERLAAVAGRVEFVVRPAEAPASVRPAVGGREAGTESSGRAYLEQRLEEQRAATQAVAAAVRSLQQATTTLDPLADRVVARDGPTGPERCYLVDRQVRDAFVREAVRCCEARGDLLVGGPWPPYTFASDGSDTR